MDEPIPPELFLMAEAMDRYIERNTRPEESDSEVPHPQPRV